MDAGHWNGDDDRDFGPVVEEERCWDCHAAEDEDCAPDCGCLSCRREVPTARQRRILHHANAARVRGEHEMADVFMALLKEELAA